MSSPTSTKRVDTDPPGEGSQKKRRKGATRLSCAECRRLKLRCDRAIPCGSCVKRGCGAICPDGSLTTGQGNRFVLASTQELHEKISELANRVRELEDALRSSHAQLSSESHPLLSEELLRIKAPLQREVPAFRNAANSSKEEENNPDVVDAFGSLSISLSGRAKYFGQTAGAWYFLQNESQEDDEPDDHLVQLQTILPPEILSRSCAFPITERPMIDDPVSLRSLFWYLPPVDKATSLRSIYFSHAAWMYNPISPETFDTQVWSQFYDGTISSPTDDPLLSHRLALMFMILAVGSLMDISQPAYSIEAEKYHQLARAALFQHSFFDEPTINAVQALFLMTNYLFLADRQGTSSGARWAIMGIAVKVAQSIGLHRDPGRWKVDPVETQRRRELFWELYTYDSWQCFTFSRPPSFTAAHVDCKMPYLGDLSDEQSFHAWKHRFTSECMSALHDQAFGAKTPTYATVLQLDRKLRAFPVPPVLQVAGFGSSEPRPGGFPETLMLTLQRHIVLAIREMNLLYLHRSFFARAVSDHPKDPLGSPYGTSVIAAYRSAGSLVALMRNLHTQLKEPSERIWFLWTHMFSCAIVLGSIVTRCPSMSLAPSALVQLDSACELFAKAARTFRAQKVLQIMLGLQQKAHISLDEFRKGKGSPLSRYPSEASPVDDNDELSTLGGKTRLVSKREPSTPSPQIMNRSPTSLNPIVPLPLSPMSREQVHPNLLAYLNTFGPTHQQAPMQSTPTYGDANSMYMPNVTQYHSEPSSYHQSQQSIPQLSMPSHPQMQHQHQHQTPSPIHQKYPQQQQQQQQQQQTIMGNTSSFPQYFPVYDYPVGTGMVVGTENGYTNNMMDNQVPQRRSSGTPEANMDSTWQDFVGGLL